MHSGHVLYQTAMLILLRLTAAARLPLLAGLPLMAIQLALLEWFRAAELSCDRGGVIAVASGATRVLEMAVVVAVGLMLLLAASRVRRLGAP